MKITYYDPGLTQFLEGLHKSPTVDISLELKKRGPQALLEVTDIINPHIRKSNSERYSWFSNLGLIEGHLAKGGKLCIQVFARRRNYDSKGKY